MAPPPPGHGARGRVSAALVCVAIVASLFPAGACGAATVPTIAPIPTQAPTAASGGADDVVPKIGPTGQPNRGRLGSRTPTVTLETPGTFSWAFLDRATGLRYQSANATETASTESMIKAWLAADHLTIAEGYEFDPDYDLLVPMIRDSDDNAAEIIYWNNGGDDSIARMITTCGLVDTQIFSGWWSLTMMSARDAVSLGECIANGAATGPAGTEWLLSEMRQVRGEGYFGVVEALSERAVAKVAIKNGWTLHSNAGIWQVNCLAIHPKWVMAVMTTYSWDLGLAHGSQICAEVTQQILYPLPPYTSSTSPANSP
jgi:hypothetical protein